MTHIEQLEYDNERLRSVLKRMLDICQQNNGKCNIANRITKQLTDALEKQPDDF